jgi:hypothetical protein
VNTQPPDWPTHAANLPHHAREQARHWEGSHAQAPIYTVVSASRVSCLDWGYDAHHDYQVLWYRGTEIAFQGGRFIPWDPLCYDRIEKRPSFASLEEACEALRGGPMPKCYHSKVEATLDDPNPPGEIILRVRCLDCGREDWTEISTESVLCGPHDIPEASTTEK